MNSPCGIAKPLCGGGGSTDYRAQYRPQYNDVTYCCKSGLPTWTFRLGFRVKGYKVPGFVFLGSGLRAKRFKVLSFQSLGPRATRFWVWGLLRANLPFTRPNP